MKASGYEYADFKITFSISIKAHLNRLRIVSKAEQTLGKDFEHNFNKSAYRAGTDFREVFKWIISPILAKQLDVPANLEGSFLINCIFCKTLSKTVVNTSSAEESKADSTD